MYKIYNKKLRLDRLNPKLGLLCSSTLVLFVEVTANFALALRSKPII